MTVGELIDRLKGMPRDAKVLAQDIQGTATDTVNVEGPWTTYDDIPYVANVTWLTTEAPAGPFVYIFGD